MALRPEDLPQEALPLDRDQGEALALNAEQRRWRIIRKLRGRKMRHQLSESQVDSYRMMRFRENYRIAAHFMIDTIARVFQDPRKRAAKRDKMERQMRIPKSPRIHQDR